MLYVFHGDDDFSLAEALRVLEAQVGAPEVREPNTHRLSAQGLTLAGLRPMTQAPPFLADARLVIVEGLLAALQGPEGRGGGRGRSKERGADAWKDFDTLVTELPPTTILVLVDGKIEGRNPLLARLTKLSQDNPKAVQVREFFPMRDAELSRWVRTRADQHGAKLAPGAIALLVELVGGNLWAMDGELAKLSLYSSGRVITEDDVRALVAQAREVNIYAAIDAIVDGRHAQASPLVERLLSGGTSPQQLIALVQRSLHQLVLTKEALELGLPQQAIGQRINIYNDYVVRRIVEQARKMSWPRITAAYQRLAEADLRLKTNDDLKGLTGGARDQFEGQMLVADLSALR